MDIHHFTPKTLYFSNRTTCINKMLNNGLIIIVNRFTENGNKNSADIKGNKIVDKKRTIPNEMILIFLMIL